MGYQAAVLGASGFAGAELLRILQRHPTIEVGVAGARANAGRAVGSLYPGLFDDFDLTLVSLEEAAASEVDIVFSSLPHTHSARLFEGEDSRKLVDLAGDFRLHDPAVYREFYGEDHPAPGMLSDWTYGLTELHREEIAGSSRVANPGCYAAGALLAVIPLVSGGLIDPNTLHIDAKSGVSGAGRASGEGFDFASVNENLRPYAVTGHKHVAEIEQELGLLAGKPVRISFVPHLVPMTRGILVTSVGERRGDATTEELLEAYRAWYEAEPFVRVLGATELPQTKHLSGTNRAEVTVRVDERTERVVAISAIDNLGKGAAGQAIQNANLMLGLDETTALLGPGGVP